MKPNLNIISGKGKNKLQEVQGIIVNKENNEFIFNYNTAIDPRESDILFLKDFRNKFVEELELLNEKLKIVGD